jgi:uncharacterized protein (DUF362 family)
MTAPADFRLDPRVHIARLSSPAYPSGAGGDQEMSKSVARLASDLGWSDEISSFGNAIPDGARVVIKPNLVMHQNHGPWGIEPLITHQSLIQAVAEAALRSGASQVVVGDAPLQTCDFHELLSATQLDRWAEALLQSEPRFKGIRDFRRTISRVVNGVRIAAEELLPEESFVIFDLARNSLLEPISDDRQSFRVTCYDPRLMARTHAPGKHQYLVARDIIEADVIINLPKLKTHKKAGVTCSLKNLIGINGNKEFLPHHRVGSASAGGDCYPENSPVKRAVEYSLDRQNMAASATSGRLWSELAVNLNRVARLTGDTLGTEGSWSGNDTIWRTCLDLNRILLYGRADGSLADEPQRRVLHIVDAVTAGHGDGPLAPQPLPLGLLIGGSNPAAVDWVGAMLLGFDPNRIPVVREAFAHFQWPIASFAASDVVLRGDKGSGAINEAARNWAPPASAAYPMGWLDALLDAPERGSDI